MKRKETVIVCLCVCVSERASIPFCLRILYSPLGESTPTSTFQGAERIKQFMASRLGEFEIDHVSKQNKMGNIRDTETELAGFG